MTYNEIMQKPGRRINTSIYYDSNGETVTLDRDSIKQAKPFFNASLIGTVMKGFFAETKSLLPLNTAIYFKNIASYGSSSANQVYGPYYLKEEGCYNADTKTYSHSLYDSFITTMVNYKPITISYPTTILNFFQRLCVECGFTTNISSLPNGSKTIENDIYDGINFTYRDVYDDIGKATGTLFCLDGLEVKICQLGTTAITIDDDILKNQNIEMGQHFGPINCIVLSRSADSDNIYKRDETLTSWNEFKISDCQLMNDNNRSDYLDDLYTALYGIEYDIFDVELVGYGVVNPLQRIQIATGGKTYNSYIFNNEEIFTQGYIQAIYTELPEETNTNYKASDTTDKRINQVYIIVDKQNQIIQSIADRTVYVSNSKSGVNSLTLENAYKGRLYELSISGQMSLIYPQSDSLYGSSLVPTNTLVPSETLVPSVSVPYGNEVNYPSSGIYPKNSVLLIDNKEYGLDLNFLNYLNEETYDEFLYHDGKCKIIRRVGVDSNGNKYALDNEFIEYRDDIDLEVDKESIIKLKSFDNIIYKATYLLDNQYTDVFATKVELNSSITQTAEQITLEVNKKVDENEIISKINQSAEQIQIDANKISLDGKEIDLTAGDITINSNHFNVDSEGNVECNGIQITDGTIQLSDESSSFGTEFSIESSDPDNVNSAKLKLWGNSVHVESTINSDNYANFGIHRGDPAVELSSNNGNTYSYLGVGELYLKNDYALGDVQVTSSGVFISNNNTSKIKLQGSNGNITCVSLNYSTLTQTSREESKKNFEKYTGALKEILNTDIYKYNLKDEKDTDKKHLGLVIGKKYNYSKEIISVDEKGKEIGVDNYSMTSLCLQAIKEQQEIIEKLKERIKKLEESDK